MKTLSPDEVDAVLGGDFANLKFPDGKRAIAAELTCSHRISPAAVSELFLIDPDLSRVECSFIGCLADSGFSVDSLRLLVAHKMLNGLVFTRKDAVDHV